MLVAFIFNVSRTSIMMRTLLILPFCGMIILAVALAFDMDYARWLEEHQRLVNDLRSMVNSHLGDAELRVLVDGVMSHYDEIFRLKGIAAKSDVFHMLSGMWKTPAERCFMWIGGFRSSELLKVINYLKPVLIAT